MHERRLKGQVALVTGAAKRLGRAAALALARDGAALVVHYDSSADEAQSVCAEIETHGVRAFPIQASFQTGCDYDALVQAALDSAGRLDILVNSASVFPSDKIETIQWDMLTSTMQVNAWAPLVLSRAFARLCEAGRIINLLDTRIEGYDWHHVSYILSKHALAVLTRMMALEYAPQFTVNAVAPGLVLPPPGREDDYLERLKHTVPLKRHGDAEDIAAAIVFLARSSFVTGQVIYVDGGRHLKEYLDGPNPD